MTRALVVWAAATAWAGLLPAQKTPAYAPPQIVEQHLVHRVRPVYPRLAREMRIEGSVELAVWISPDGGVKEIRLIRGHPLLVKAAMDAVSQWRYRPAFWWYRPEGIVTSVVVRFSLGLPHAPDQPGGEQTIVHVSQ